MCGSLGFNAEAKLPTLSREGEEQDRPPTYELLPDGNRTQTETSSKKPRETDELDHEDKKFQQLNLDTLKHRGVRTYRCPKGRACGKGGLDDNGDPIVFKRNSAFM
ncbi:hypothetical protein S40288_06001 [Stachybotrys chartarum IBT 40288]|nr:hypothetical protein S40288_06001 [Stachybotrys chartarum IBT 40288]